MENVLVNEKEQKKAGQKAPRLVATLVVVQTSDGKIKITMYPDDKKMVKTMIFNAFRDKDFKEVIFDATIAETNAILEQRGIDPAGSEISSANDLIACSCPTMFCEHRQPKKIH